MLFALLFYEEGQLNFFKHKKSNDEGFLQDWLDILYCRKNTRIECEVFSQSLCTFDHFDEFKIKNHVQNLKRSFPENQSKIRAIPKRTTLFL